MAYSSIYESDSRQRRSKIGPFSQLEINLVLAGNDTYILAMPRNKQIPVEGIVFKNFVDLVVKGFDKAKQIALYLSKACQTYVGIVEYTGQAISRLQMQAEEASEIAKGYSEPFHVYNPRKDSLTKSL